MGEALRASIYSVGRNEDDLHIEECLRPFAIDGVISRMPEDWTDFDEWVPADELAELNRMEKEALALAREEDEEFVRCVAERLWTETEITSDNLMDHIGRMSEWEKYRETSEHYREVNVRWNELSTTRKQAQAFLESRRHDDFDDPPLLATEPFALSAHRFSEQRDELRRMSPSPKELRSGPVTGMVIGQPAWPYDENERPRGGWWVTPEIWSGSSFYVQERWSRRLGRIRWDSGVYYAKVDSLLT